MFSNMGQGKGQDEAAVQVTEQVWKGNAEKGETVRICKDGREGKGQGKRKDEMPKKDRVKSERMKG